MDELPPASPLKPPSWLKWTIVTFHGLWLGLVALEVLALSIKLSDFLKTQDRIETAEQGLQKSYRELVDMAAQSEEQTRELKFLHGLLDVIPQDKGFARTQKAISEEVQYLRRKVGRRLKNRVHAVVDTRANKFYVKRGLTLLFQADCSVGRGGILRDRRTGRRWEFVTPRGEFRVLGKIANPVWTKPDWAFVESGQDVPPPGDPSRKVPGELGAYVLNLGDGYLIHGTRNVEALGTAVSHGCVRLGAENLKKLYELVPIGTRVYIY